MQLSIMNRVKSGELSIEEALHQAQLGREQLLKQKSLPEDEEDEEREAEEEKEEVGGRRRSSEEKERQYQDQVSRFKKFNCHTHMQDVQ